jgi:peptidyl-prolyl cis-trans isomerase SurA
MRLRSTFLTLLLASTTAVPAVVRAQGAPLRTDLIERVVAVVGDRPILITELYEALNTKIARNEPIARDTAQALRATLQELIDAELLTQQGRRFGITVADIELTEEVDRTIARQRGDMTDREYLAALKEGGFGTPDDYRRKRIEDLRRIRIQQQAVDSLRAKGRLPSMNVSEAEVQQVFDSLKASFPRSGPTVAFRQIVITPKPRAESEARAKALADSLHALVVAGANFDTLAIKFSSDSGSGANGGDLGWAKRGSYVPEFETYAFGLRPGALSPVFRSTYGYHFLRVERARAAETRVRHILITPTRDSIDVRETVALSERVAAALRGGASYDSLVQAHHDMIEDRILSEPFILDSLPGAYRTAIAPLKVNEVSSPFQLPDPRGAVPKVAIVQLQMRSETGEPQFSQYQARIRASLQQERSFKRLIDQLRAETYVSIRL